MQKRKECSVWLQGVMGRVREGSIEKKTLGQSLQERVPEGGGRAHRHGEAQRLRVCVEL